MRKWADGRSLPTNMATAIQMFGDFQNFEQSYLLHLLVYGPETLRDLSKSGYIHCMNISSKKSLT